MYNRLFNADMSTIMKLTGCLSPCAYKEYSFVNTNPKEYTLVNTIKSPENSLAFCLWSVSQNTLVEEESLVYSFESWLAEFGGSLGLFLGFSFVTISDGMKSLAIWMKKNVKLCLIVPYLYFTRTKY